jgi:hypothetical protein
MRRFALVPAVVLGLAVLGAGAALLAPKQVRAAGLDFWNVGTDEADLKAATLEARDLEADHDRSRRRGEVVAQLVTSLSEDRITATEALDELAALARCSPEWLSGLRFHYQALEFVSPSAPDQEVLIRFLHIRLETERLAAEDRGDTARAAVLAARLVRYDNEIQHLPSPAANPTAAR